ncbi:MAG: hypothetical protein AAB361_03900 [Patescibacteria group bacterium]
MRISFTDEFLWDVYNIIEETKNVAGFVFRPYPTMKNSLPGPKNPIFKKYQKERGKKEFSKLIYYLKRKGYIKIKNLENKQAIILTKGGIGRALRASFKLGNKNKRKDGKWVMLIFDIPENNRKSRSLLRGALRNLGYKIFQQSVWISPYDVSEKTEIFIQQYSLDKYVKIFLIEEI